MTHSAVQRTLRATGRAKKAASSLALGWLLLSLTTPAIAQSASDSAPDGVPSQPLQILAVQSDDAVNAAQAITGSLKNAAKRQVRVELLPGDYSLEVLSLALGCADAPDRGCLTRIANKIHAPAFVWGDLKHADQRLSLSVHLYRRGEPDRSAEIRYDPNSDPDALEVVADRVLSELLATGERPPNALPTKSTGTLLLDAGDLDGWVAIDGVPAGGIREGHAELELPIGEREVTVHANGYRDVQGTIGISASGPVVLHLRAQKIGNPPAPAVADSAPRVLDDKSNTAAALSALVVGGAFLAAGLYSSARVDLLNRGAEFDGYRSGTPENQDACTAADRGVVVRGAASPTRISALCTQGKTFEALQYVFFGLGAVAAGTGALILVTSGESRSSGSEKASRQGLARLQPSVSVSPHSAALSLRLHF